MTEAMLSVAVTRAACSRAFLRSYLERALPWQRCRASRGLCSGPPLSAPPAARAVREEQTGAILALGGCVVPIVWPQH